MQRRRLLALGGMALGAAGRSARAQDEGDRMYRALETLPKVRLAPPGGEIDVVFLPEVPAVQRPVIMDWINLSVAALVQYFGQFPSNHLGLLPCPLKTWTG